MNKKIMILSAVILMIFSGCNDKKNGSSAVSETESTLNSVHISENVNTDSVSTNAVRTKKGGNSDSENIKTEKAETTVKKEILPDKPLKTENKTTVTSENIPDTPREFPIMTEKQPQGDSIKETATTKKAAQKTSTAAETTVTAVVKETEKALEVELPFVPLE